jgi:hypothetical protein
MKKNKIVRSLSHQLKCTAILICFNIGCHAQNSNLSTIYKEYTKDKSISNLRLFFYSFPNSYGDLQKLYGYDDVAGEAPFYKDAREHITVFFKSSVSVNAIVFSKKLLKISKHGKWDADAVNYFQEGLRSYFFSRPKEILNILKLESEESTIDFWYFFSDGPHFDKAVYDKVVPLLKKSPSMLRCYLKAVKAVKKDNEE